MRAVVFDLWETLVPYPARETDELYAAMAAHLGVDEERFVGVWKAARRDRETGPLLKATRVLCESLDLEDADVEGVLALRREYTRRALVPRPGALDVLRRLRARGLLIGLITVCTDDVEEAWPHTTMAPLFDATVFSCEVRVSKPDARIYAIAAERLGVAAAECIFVGDGTNDELRGAERAGMRAVQLRLPEHGERDWDGAYVASLEQVLGLV